MHDGRAARIPAALDRDPVPRAMPRARPDALALIDPPDSRPSPDVAAHVSLMRRRIARLMPLPRGCARSGFRRGTVVAIQMPNIADSVIDAARRDARRHGAGAAAAVVAARRLRCRACRVPAPRPSSPAAGLVISIMAQLALEIAAELFPIRAVCGFGCGLADGIVPIDDCLPVRRGPAPTFRTFVPAVRSRHLRHRRRRPDAGRAQRAAIVGGRPAVRTRRSRIAKGAPCSRRCRSHPMPDWRRRWCPG